jgi:hypothetical protein
LEELMGVSSDAMLFYGFSADDGGWEGVDTDEDWEVVIAAKTERTVGWVAYPIPEEVLLNTRMHLTDDQVRELVSVLNTWLETGSLHKTPE